MIEQLRELVREMRDRKFYDLFDYAPQVKEWIDRLESLLPAQPAAGEFDEDDGGIDYSYSPSQCVPASPKEEAAVDEALGLVRVVLRFPTLLHSTLTAEAESRGIAFPALIREKLTAKQPAAGEAVAFGYISKFDHDFIARKIDGGWNGQCQVVINQSPGKNRVPLYTHPTANQADAEQLRELVKVVEEMEGACVYPDGSPSTNTIEPGSVRSWAFRLRAARAQSDGRSGGEK